MVIIFVGFFASFQEKYFFVIPSAARNLSSSLLRAKIPRCARNDKFFKFLKSGEESFTGFFITFQKNCNAGCLACPRK
jgi:hypothetical protein